VSVSYLFLLFLAYSFIGWACEVIYCSIKERKIVNRGFLMGPLCPVYGFGGLLIVFLLRPFADNVFYLFTMAVLITSLLEYFTSWALESLFATKWWDYSHYRFNIHGRVCLLNSLIFGAMGVLGIRFVHPAILFVLDRIPLFFIGSVAGILGLIFAVDIAFTLRTLVDFRKKLAQFASFMENTAGAVDVREWFNEFDLEGSLARIRERLKTDNSELNRNHNDLLGTFVRRSRGTVRLFRAFPGMQSRHHGPLLDPFRRFHKVAAGLKTAIDANSAARDMANSSAMPAPKKRERPFEYFWVFFFASFIGVVLETIWCVVTTGRVENRTGLLYGMLNPVYGAGAILMTSFLSRLEKKRDITVFFGCMLIGGAFEYACSLTQELVFGSVSWEYSGTTLSIQGRTNLLFALLWGILGLLWVRDIHPLLTQLVRKLPARPGKITAIVLCLGLIINCAMSAVAVRRWSERLQSVGPSNSLEIFLDAQYPDSFMWRIYPNMQFVHR